MNQKIMPVGPKPVNLNRSKKTGDSPPNPLRAAQFKLAAHRMGQLPTDQGSEVAFAGRSNAGKSSALNVLCGLHGLARVSKTPGRTQQLVVFDISDHQRLIDLPGYGFAKVPMDLRAHWGEQLQQYFQSRNALKAVVQFCDVRHPLSETDRMMLALSQSRQLPTALVLTKSDKLSRGAGLKARDAVRRECPNANVEVFLFSALAKSGVEEVRAFVTRHLGIA